MANTIAGSINKIELPNGNRYEIHDTRIGVSANEELSVDRDLILSEDLILSGILYGAKDIYIGDDVSSLQHKSNEYRVAVSSSDSGRLQLFANDSSRGLYAIDTDGTGRIILSIDANNMATLTECTIKDALHIKKETVNIEQSNNHVNENQTNNTYFGINFVDVSNNNMGGFRTFAKTDGAVGVQMYAYNFINGSSPNAPYNGLLFQVDKNGNYYYSTEDPQAFRKMLELSTDGAWPIPIGNGGTGAITAAGARTALGITPANIGALSLSGGTVTEDIFVQAVNSDFTDDYNGRASLNYAIYPGFKIKDGADHNIGYFQCGIYPDGRLGIDVSVRNYVNNDINSSSVSMLRMTQDKSGNVVYNTADVTAFRNMLKLGTNGNLPLTIAQGGTNATSATDARTNLEVYSKTETDTAIQNSTANANLCFKSFSYTDLSASTTIMSKGLISEGATYLVILAKMTSAATDFSSMYIVRLMNGGLHIQSKIYEGQDNTTPILQENGTIKKKSGSAFVSGENYRGISIKFG